ncbi:hypothetical protein RFI_37187, partial [Reticulomyxa filosa]
SLSVFLVCSIAQVLPSCLFFFNETRLFQTTLSKIFSLKRSRLHLDDELTTEEEKRDFDNGIEKALTQEFFFLQKRKQNTRDCVFFALFKFLEKKRTNYVNKSKNKSFFIFLISPSNIIHRLLSFGSYVAQEEIEDESLYKLLCWRIIKKKRRKNKDNSELSHNLKEEKNETSIG